MDNFDHIQDYLDGILSQADRERFERGLVQDEALRNETDRQRELRDTIRKHLDAAEGIPALLQTLEQVGGRHFGRVKRPGGMRIVRWLIPIVAAACLLVVVNYFGWLATDFEALPHMAAQVSRGDSTAAAAEHAAELFNAGEYQGSAELLETIVAFDASVVRYRYFLGLSYLGLDDKAHALQHLQPIADGPSVFADDARYFTALVLWRMGDRAKAMHYANMVPQGNTYHAKAQELLKQLGR